jgi:hypothetical protein
MLSFILNIREFDMHAAWILDKCFAQSEELALQILTTKSKLYFDYSPLELAIEGNNRSFLGTKCVQKHLDKLWYGNINNHGHHKIFIDLLVNQNSISLLLMFYKFQILILCIFPFLVPYPSIYQIFKSSTKKKS